MTMSVQHNVYWTKENTIFKRFRLRYFADVLQISEDSNINILTSLAVWMYCGSTEVYIVLYRTK